MSHPLKRRIVRAALVVAAGTAPVVGAAGAASAVELPSTNGLSPVSALDTGSLPEAAGTAGHTASQTGGEVLTTGAETAAQLGESAGPTAEKALGALQETTGKTVEQGQATVGETAGNLGGGLPTEPLGLV